MVLPVGAAGTRWRAASLAGHAGGDGVPCWAVFETQRPDSYFMKELPPPSSAPCIAPTAVKLLRFSTGAVPNGTLKAPVEWNLKGSDQACTMQTS